MKEWKRKFSNLFYEKKLFSDRINGVENVTGK